MSDHVIIVGARRGRELVPTAELNQMVGRIGRRHDGQSYKADIILKEEDARYESVFKEEIMGESAVSVMSCPDKAVFHILPYVSSGKIKTRDDVSAWSRKTLSFAQGKPPCPDKIIEALVFSGAAFETGGEIRSTRIGSVCASLYIHPWDLSLLKKNLLRCGWGAQDSCLAWSLGHLKTVTAGGDFGNRRDSLSSFLDDLPSGYECKTGRLVTSALWWCILGNAPAGKDMALSVAALRKRWHGLKTGLLLTGEDEQEVRSLDVRIRKGVRRELVPFFSVEGMTKSRAEALFEMGYASPEGTEGVETGEWDG